VRKAAVDEMHALHASCRARMALAPSAACPVDDSPLLQFVDLADSQLEISDVGRGIGEQPGTSLM